MDASTPEATDSVSLSSRIRDYIRQNVLGLIAIYIALGGVAWALEANSVKSKHIVNGQVKGVDVAPAQVQKRVSGNCPAGQAVRVVNENGTVACAAVGGSGLPTGPAGGDLAGNYPNPEIGGGKVGSPEVAANSLTAADLAPDSVGGDELQVDAVGFAHILEGGVQTSEVEDNSLTAADLAPNSVGFSELAPNAVASSQIIDGQVASADVGDNSLTGADIQNESIGFTELAPNSVGDSEIADNEIKSAHVFNDTLTGADISEPTLTPSDATDYYNATCDPSTTTYIACGPGLQFTAGQSMSVMAMWTYGFGSDGSEQPRGFCRTTLDGADLSGDIALSLEDADLYAGGIPILDVISVSAGTHTLGFRCSEGAPVESADLVVRELRIGVVELGFD